MKKCLTLLTTLFVLSSVGTSSLAATVNKTAHSEVIEKGLSKSRKIHGTWKFTIPQFLAASGDFTFRMLITSPTGKQYKTKPISSANLPATPLILEIENPRSGQHIIFFELLSINVSGSISFISTISNNKNHREYILPVDMETDPRLVGKRFTMSAFSIP